MDKNEIVSLDGILSSFFAAISSKEDTISMAPNLLSVLKDLYAQRVTAKILDLPKEIDYKGTMIIIKIPAAIPYGFNLYNYTS